MYLMSDFSQLLKPVLHSDMMFGDSMRLVYSLKLSSMLLKEEHHTSLYV